MLIRKLHDNEAALYADHLKRLSQADRCSRFSEAYVSDDLIDRYVAGISQDDLLMGAFANGVMVGGVHVGLGGGVAEIGISIEAGHRGQKLGNDLMEHAVNWARNRHAEKLYTMCSDGNVSMQALAKHVGMNVTHDHGVAEATMPLDPPDLVTITDEMASNVQEAIHDWAHMIEQCQELWLGTFHLR